MPTVPDIHRRGTRADQATISPPLTVGTLYFVTDESVTERWNGSAWESYSGPDAGSAPTVAHAPTHQAGGSDPLKLDDLAAPDDTADLNASASAHGLLRKLSGTPTEYLNGNGAWSTPATGGGTPAAHKTTHENGGADEISVAGLSGLLGDSQVPLAHKTSHEAGGSDVITALDAGVITTGTLAAARLPARVGAVGIIIDGGGSAITTGVKGFVSVPFACTITGWMLLSTDASATAGSIVIDVWKDVYSAYPPTVADTIFGTKPSLSSANKNSATGLSISVTAGDVLGYNVDSATTVTRVALSLTVQAT